MDPARKRRIRLIVALSAAVLLASALVYTSFNTSDEAVSPSKLLASATPGRNYQLTGVVVPNTTIRNGDETDFRVGDRAGGGRNVLVHYTGTIPDPFRDGREIIVTVRKDGSGYMGERDSLITKCPSKYKATTS